MGFLSDITGTGAVKPQGLLPPASLDGQVWIVTGGHAGIGQATTKGLALAGAKVYIASRTPSKVADAKKELVAAHPELEGRLEFLQLDLASLKATNKAAEEFLTREKRLNGIVNNAGIMAVPYALTEDGIECQWQVNHLAHFLFTNKLVPLLEETGKATGHPSRVINLASFAHNFISWYPFASPSFTSLAKVNRSFEPLGYIRYSQAKLSAILFSREFNRRMSPHVRSLAVHPGFVKSDLYKSQAMMKPFVNSFISVDEGALTSLYAATSPEVETKKLWGSYLVPHGKIKKTSAYGRDPKLAADMWDLCEALIAEKVGPTSI